MALSVLETSRDLQWLTVEGPWARQVTGVKKEERTGQLEPDFKIILYAVIQALPMDSKGPEWLLKQGNDRNQFPSQAGAKTPLEALNFTSLINA